MKKNYFLLILALICFYSNAQVKMYEYPSQILTEEGISKLVEQAKQNGTPEMELKKFHELLRIKMENQRKALFSGVSDKSGNIMVNSVGCPNAGFENGTNSNWTFSSANINGVNLPCNACPTGTTAINNIVNSVSTIVGQCRNGVDSFGLFPVVAPGGGLYSLILNDANYMSKMQQASYSFVVDSTFNIYSTQYATVLNSGGTSHSPLVQAYFSVSITDNNTGSIIPCTQYEVSVAATGSMPGWSISPFCGGNACYTVYYKPWTTALVDLSSIIGHTVTVSYIVSDCNQGGHFGYTYIDGSCSFMSHLSYMCGGQNAYVCGPAGFNSYHWTGPVTDSSQCITAATAGIYTLNLTGSGGCIPSDITYTVSTSSLLPPTLTITGADSICIGQDNTLTASGASSYVWTNGISNGVAFTPTATANYVVTGTDVNGCSAEDSIRVVVNSCSTGIKNAGATSSIKLYPNPANNVVTLQSEEKLGAVFIYNSIGELVFQANSQSTKTEIDLSKLPVGIYTVKTQNKYLRLVKE